jgi:hypothetical protein
MLRLLLPVVLGLVGAAAGIGVGLYLKPPPEEAAAEEHAAAAPCGDPAAPDAPADAAHAAEAGHAGGDDHDAAPGTSEFVKLNNQFVVPVMEDGRIVSLVVLSLSLETPVGGREIVFQREPKLRDAFLQVLFDHANSGGFSGAFTGGDRIEMLRRALRSAAQMALGPTAIDVLVTDIARQDV